MSQQVVRLVDVRSALTASACALTLLAAALLGSGLAAGPASSGSSAQPAPDYGDLPLSFQPAAGRYEGIDYLSSGAAGSIAVGPDGIRFEQSYGTKRNPKAAAIALRLPGATLENPTAHQRLPGVVNDLRGDDPAKHVTEIPTFASLSYAEAWPGIDLVLRGSGANPEYDFELAPGADPSRISMRIAGADSARIAPSGDLLIRSGGAVFRQKAPVSYQPSPDGRIPVESSFRLEGRTVSFELGAYEPERKLVIDPVALAYSTYLGGNGTDVANAIAIDASGAAYIAGSTGSTDFNTVGPIEGDSAGGDAFITKLNPAGSALAYSTYLGGNAYDQANAIAVDASGAAYVTGYALSSDFDTVGPIEGDSAGIDTFIAKLNPAGSALAYSTYLGGNDTDLATAIAVDSSGAAYVTGYTDSSDFDTVGPIEGDSAGSDAFIAKLNPAGSALAYSTYLGGNDYDEARAIAVDSSGAAYVTGYTSSSDFDTVGPIEGDGAGVDAFIVKITAPDTTIVSGPAQGSTIADATPTFTFSSDNPTAGFECRIDGGPWEGCESPRTLPNEGDGTRTFKVRAIDDVGNFDLAPPTRNFTVDTTPPPGDSTPPDVFFTSGPTGTTNDSTPSFGFAMSEAGSFQCRADGAAFAACSSPATTATLPDGNHTFEVRGIDSAGNRSTVSRSFTVDTTPPQTLIASAPTKLIAKKKTARAKIAFYATEPGSKASCKLDSKPAAPCTSPFASKLKKGTHTIAITATDKAGNADPTPATATIKVKKKKRKRKRK